MVLAAGDYRLVNIQSLAIQITTLQEIRNMYIPIRVHTI